MVNNFFNKRAQVADTTTWVFATFAIIIILIISIYFASVLGSSKMIGGSKGANYGQKNLIIEKSFYAYSLTKTSDNGLSVYNKLNQLQDSNDEIKSLADNIFKSLYSGDAVDIIISIGDGSDIIETDSIIVWTNILQGHFGSTSSWPRISRNYIPFGESKLLEINLFHW